MATKKKKEVYLGNQVDWLPTHRLNDGSQLSFVSRLEDGQSSFIGSVGESIVADENDVEAIADGNMSIAGLRVGDEVCYIGGVNFPIDSELSMIVHDFMGIHLCCRMPDATRSGGYSLSPWIDATQFEMVQF